MPNMNHNLSAYIMRKGILLLSSVFILALLACSSHKDDEAEDQTAAKTQQEIPVEVIALEPASFTESGTYYGTVQGVSEAQMVSYAGGHVSEIKVKAGQYVNQGQQLCDIEGDKFITASKSAQLNQKIAEDDYNRAKAHMEKGTYSQLQVERALQKSLQMRQMVLEAEKQRKGALCISPISGTVTHIHIERNQELPPGSPTISVASLNRLKVKVGVPETEVTGYKTGLKSVVKIPGDTASLQGTIHSISQQVLSKNRSFEVEARFANRGRVLKPGQSAEVILFKKPLKEAIVVPSESILNLEKDNVVMVVNDNFAHRRIIVKGPSNASHTVVKSGLEAGDLLIVKGHALVSDGSLVKVMN
jgi:membrane fusion protein (multidrug efflux system)